MSAGGLCTGLNKGSLILFVVGKKLGLNSHMFVCIQLSSACVCAERSWKLKPSVKTYCPRTKCILVYLHFQDESDLSLMSLK